MTLSQERKKNEGKERKERKEEGRGHEISRHPDVAAAEVQVASVVWFTLTTDTGMHHVVLVFQA